MTSPRNGASSIWISSATAVMAGQFGTKGRDARRVAAVRRRTLTAIPSPLPIGYRGNELGVPGRQLRQHVVKLARRHCLVEDVENRAHAVRCLPGRELELARHPADEFPGRDPNGRLADDDQALERLRHLGEEILAFVLRQPVAALGIGYP